MLKKLVEELLYYAETHLDLDPIDEMFIRNTLLHEFNLDEPYYGEIDKKEIEAMTTPTSLLKKMRELIPEMDAYSQERIMSFLSPRPSDVARKFNSLRELDSKKACEYFFNLMICNNYIKSDEIKKNIKWEYQGENNTLEITINMTKPEKNNKDIAKLKDAVITSYPTCLLCYSNEGFYGGGKFQPRSNIRVVPMKFGDEDWFMQYSPYAYYHEHAIIINKIHTPMRITNDTILNETRYVDLCPNYFVGCNSDLPIVGGSLLHHMHFQGGSHLMPMMFAKPRYTLKNNISDKVEVEYLDWYNSCLVVSSENKDELLKVTGHILDIYWTYSDKESELIASDENGRHNTATTITRKVDGKYMVYIILRNNRCNDEYPEGIFHAHPEYHNIKKEGIGLIEAMGLFILPGRLKTELDLIADILSEQYKNVADYIKENECLEKHIDFINKLISKYSRRNTKEQAMEFIRHEVGFVCENVLKNTGIYKDDLKGQLSLMKFFKTLNFEVME